MKNKFQEDVIREKLVVNIKRPKNYPNIVVMVNDKGYPFGVSPSAKSNKIIYILEAYLFMKENNLKDMFVRINSNKLCVITQTMSVYEVMTEANRLEETYPETMPELIFNEVDVAMAEIPVDVKNNPVLKYYLDKMNEIFLEEDCDKLMPVVEDGQIKQISSSSKYNTAYSNYVSEYNKALEARQIGNEKYLEYIKNRQKYILNKSQENEKEINA